MTISHTTVICKLRSVFLVLEFMFFMVFRQNQLSSLLLELKISFTSFLLTLRVTILRLRSSLFLIFVRSKQN